MSEQPTTEQDALDEGKCPQDGLPIAYGYDCDGDGQGIWFNHWAECPNGHHYRAEWVGTDDYRAMWEEE